MPDADEKTLKATTIYSTPVPPPIPTVAPEVQEKIKRAVSTTGEIIVQEKLSKPHVIVAKWIADHEKSQKEAKMQGRRYGMHWPVPADLTPADRRRHRIYDAVLKALERLGGKIALDDRASHIQQLSG